MSASRSPPLLAIALGFESDRIGIAAPRRGWRAAGPHPEGSRFWGFGAVNQVRVGVGCPRPRRQRIARAATDERGGCPGAMTWEPPDPAFRCGMFPTPSHDIEPGKIFKSAGYTPRRAQPFDPKGKLFGASGFRVGGFLGGADWRFAVKRWTEKSGGGEIAFSDGILQPRASGEGAGPSSAPGLRRDL
jgi:hypothetical protein